MAARHVTAAHRRRPIGAGHPVDEQPDAGKVIGITRDEDGRVVVVVDHGDHRTRVTWMALVKASLTRKPAPPLDALEQHPAPMLAELAEEERAAVSKRYRDLVQIETGSLRGNPEADRRAGILNPAYDPKTTTSAERLITKSRELKALGEVGASRASLYRQVGRIGEGPDFLIHGNRRTLTQRLDEFDPAVVEIVREEVAAESQRPRKSQRKLLVRIRSRLDRAAVADEVTRHQLGVLVGEVFADAAFTTWQRLDGLSPAGPSPSTGRNASVAPVNWSKSMPPLRRWPFLVPKACWSRRSSSVRSTSTRAGSSRFESASARQHHGTCAP